MTDFYNEKILEIIEVPEELRGPSDEEIIRMSEKVLKEVSGKRKKGERRPSKKVRIAMREQKAKLEAQQIAMEIFGAKRQSPSTNDAFRCKPRPLSDSRDLPSEKQELVSSAFTSRSPGYCSYVPPASLVKKPVENVVVDSPRAVSAPPPPGRILKASFGLKTTEKPKAVIVTVAELARQKAEERAKKIRDALMAKKNPGQPIGENGACEAAQPVKRPRGRPRKNPI